jgi:acyl-CoA thioester hydrolase
VSAPSSRPEGWIHRYPLRVQFDEVDQYGIVHHPRYFVFFERARVELMGLLGMTVSRPEISGLGLIVASAEVKFLRSASFLDELVVEQGCRQSGASRIKLVYRILRGDEVMAKSELVLAFVDASGRPCRAPADIREGLAGMGVPGESPA